MVWRADLKPFQITNASQPSQPHLWQHAEWDRVWQVHSAWWSTVQFWWWWGGLNVLGNWHGPCHWFSSHSKKYFIVLSEFARFFETIQLPLIETPPWSPASQRRKPVYFPIVIEDFVCFLLLYGISYVTWYMLLYFHFGDTPNSKLFWLWQSTGYICIWAPLWSIYKVVIKEIGPYVQPMCHWRSKTLHLWCTAHQILAYNVMQLHIAHSSVSILQSKDSLSQYSKPWLYSSPIRMLFDELSMRHHGDEVRYLRYPNLVIYRAF